MLDGIIIIEKKNYKRATIRITLPQAMWSQCLTPAPIAQ